MESNNPILFVKSEKYLAGPSPNLSSTLSRNGYSVMMSDFHEIENVTDRYLPVLAIAMLPGLPATDLQICYQLLRLIRVPIIAISSFDDSDCRIAAFDAGIADFLVTPFNSLELVARVRNILCRQFQKNNIPKEALFINLESK